MGIVPVEAPRHLSAPAQLTSVGPFLCLLPGLFEEFTFPVGDLRFLDECCRVFGP